MWYDIVIGLVLLFTMYRGAQRGLVWQLAWIGALVLSFKFAADFAPQLAPHIRVQDEQLQKWIAMFVLYMGFAFLSFAVARILRGWIEQAKFTEFDRHLGAIFGLAKGVLIALMVTFFSVTIFDSWRPSILETHTGYASAVIMETIEPVLPAVLPASIHEHVAKHAGKLQRDGRQQNNEGGDFGFDDIVDVMNGQNSQGGEAPIFGGEPDGQGGGNPLFGPGFGGNQSQAGNRNPTGTGNQNQTGNSSSPTLGGALQDLLRKIPSSVGQQLKDATVQKFQNASPEERQQLIGQLSDSFPGGIEGALQRWQSGNGDLFNNDNFGRETNRFRPLNGNASAPTNPASYQEPRIDAAKVMSDIAAIYTDRNSQRTAIINDIQGKLSGLPASVSERVLADWYADLMGTDPDPDPQTVIETYIDSRILRQLQAAGVPVSRLSSDLQQRMKNAVRQ